MSLARGERAWTPYSWFAVSMRMLQRFTSPMDAKNMSCTTRESAQYKKYPDTLDPDFQNFRTYE